MVDIIPNWHPIFVHFTIALVTVSAFCYLIGYFFQANKWGQELLIVGRWCLWFGAIAAIATVIAGFIAFYSVRHDSPAHTAMIMHRNWALATFSLILIASGWSCWLYFKEKQVSMFFIFIMLLSLSLVHITAWHGAELVYRHGVGVISLPETNHSDHQHSH